MALRPNLLSELYEWFAKTDWPCEQDEFTVLAMLKLADAIAAKGIYMISGGNV